MLDTFGDKDDKMRKAFAEKVKNMVGIIRQNLQNHGGNIELISIDINNTVKVRLQCESEDCPEAQQVLETGVKELLRQRIPAEYNMTAKRQDDGMPGNITVRNVIQKDFFGELLKSYRRAA